MFQSIIDAFSGFVWQGILLPCVFIGGIWFTLRTRGLQIIRFGHAMGQTLGRIFKKGDKGEGSVTPLQALCTALAGTVGTGSIVGTCQALVLGGPGALFWLTVSAFLGMIIKFFEVTLAICFRRKNSQGEWIGGPMYYIIGGMGEKWKPLAVLFSLFAVLSSFGMGDLAQANSVSAGVRSALFSVADIPLSAGGAVSLGVGLLLAVFLSFALFGGAKRIGRVAEILVPVMSLLFVGFTLWVIFVHRARLPEAILLIFRAAFSEKALLGAGAGITAKTALEWGLKRSAFSNEAGLGSAAIAHASAQTDHPVRQGFFGIFEVFVDTLVVCLLTGITILVSVPPESVMGAPDQGASLITDAFATVFGARFASFFIGLSLALFAFSTLLGWSLYGARCVQFLFGTAAQVPYRILFILCTVPGACLSMEPIWALSDLFNGLMAIPNFIALFALSGTVLSLVRDYFSSEKKKRKAEKHLTERTLCDKLSPVGKRFPASGEVSKWS